LVASLHNLGKGNRGERRKSGVLKGALGVQDFKTLVGRVEDFAKALRTKEGGENASTILMTSEKARGWRRKTDDDFTHFYSYFGRTG